ncbi:MULTISPECIES: TlpA family protein disulfide reductase [Chryseobacterium]|uniref:Stage IV sporulation protein H n=1 Tax=Chryseobacterium indoltheticum TaxID=254 RepID=A0A381FBG1_9FLAO|nr:MULTISPECIES: TlpA disulfide reductase family protein [Chryseobacterium]AZA73705.1 TlpA family protein disulfide reductase [Chryseobacterium indoltheticum]SIQ92226.1 Thiol-disulfide isomerase or thioredoxin [Chryseobacterium indoltheticum]SUX43803.1 Stage IV sporulation protein H [Chryseobacterium indoltheticum]
MKITILKLKVLLPILLTFSFVLLSSQNKFLIEGTSKFYNNKELSIYPIQLNVKDTASAKLKLLNNKVKVINNKFLINGIIDDFPHALEISYYDKEENRVYFATFFVDNSATNYKMSVNDLIKYKHIDLHSKSQEEFNLIVKQLEDNGIELMPFDSDNFIKKNDFLRKYIKENPNSYVALWMIISDYRYIGFNEGFSENLTFFGDKIKKSKLYEDLILTIKRDKKFTMGNDFPALTIDKTQLQKGYGKKYTLIDFWFSYCAPCLKDLPAYKSIYNQYNESGFEYIGISTDRSQDIQNWKKVIKNYDLKWLNVLDENGVEAINLNITRFPTNFLLDSHGKIIAKDISPDELKSLLDQK